jgi:nucleotide-binding universal stress UspA family protein
MNVRPSILCPIDFSEPSAAALRYAAALARHFALRLIVLTVEEPLLAAAMEFNSGQKWSRALTEQELAGFVAETFANDAARESLCEYEVAVGKPAVEILRVAGERSCDLIVMSSHGLSGARKVFFGSTTERVLRDTTIPVLVTPPSLTPPLHMETLKAVIQRIVVPVDLSSSSVHQTQAASRIAQVLDLPLVLVHVLEPVRSRLLARLDEAGLDATRRAEAETGLDRLQAVIPARVARETLIVFGDPAEETCNVVRDRQAGLVVMGLHGSPLLGPRMGSVTYRILRLSPALVLALPPKAAESIAYGQRGSTLEST